MNLIEKNDFIVGFRPENFLPRAAFESEEDLRTLRFRVEQVEYLGSDRFIYGTLEAPFEGEKVIADLPHTVSFSIKKGEAYEFAVKEDNIKFFDRDKGHRIEPRVF